MSYETRMIFIFTDLCDFIKIMFRFIIHVHTPVHQEIVKILQINLIYPTFYSSIEPLTIPLSDVLIKLSIRSRSIQGSYSVSIAFNASVLFSPRVYNVR